MSEAIAPARRFIPLFGRDDDARRLPMASLLCNGFAYAHLLLAASGILPEWTLLVTVPVLVPRWMIAFTSYSICAASARSIR
ncbi:MAG: hypothetical protein IPH26_08230 [Sterolibacteriaceae bacterium]|uniref:Uncharacterized protein n=1 Tax=Candidatus Methylophosphatis roskildensis TaxID=2899263 RepID=A0A9D7E329_9PROT|nr:hypothetical protein [Candidatus Methylophosphatis roskildensis]MBK7237662.1 hypothetical protein [Sterolibacteriaceae bacterium]